MKDLELNKIAAAILMAGLIAMLTGKFADILYHPQEVAERGFSVEVAEVPAGGAVEEEEAPIDVAALMASADAAKGESLMKKCAACHSFDAGGPNKVGPKLYGTYGRDIASLGDYSYSDALKNIEGSWDEEHLFGFLKSPRKYAPGNKMGFAGFKNPEDVANLVAYLKTLK